MIYAFAEAMRDARDEMPLIIIDGPAISARQNTQMLV